MPWTYQQATGLMLDPLGQSFARGYSGTGFGRNNPDAQALKGVGPIPVGRYLIAAARLSAELGPIVMDLQPLDGTDTLGRDLFRIHGNNAANDASHGCIILDRTARGAIAGSTERVLEVVR